MNVGVEIALFGVGGGALAIVRDIYIRVRVEASESLARTDRLEKERMERQQTEDFKILELVPAFATLLDETTTRELSAEHKLVLEKDLELEQNARDILTLRGTIDALQETIRKLRGG